MYFKNNIAEFLIRKVCNLLYNLMFVQVGLLRNVLRSILYIGSSTLLAFLCNWLIAEVTAESHVQIVMLSKVLWMFYVIVVQLVASRFCSDSVVVIAAVAVCLLFSNACYELGYRVSQENNIRLRLKHC